MARPARRAAHRAGNGVGGRTVVPRRLRVFRAVLRSLVARLVRPARRTSAFCWRAHERALAGLHEWRRRERATGRGRSARFGGPSGFEPRTTDYGFVTSLIVS